MWSERAKTRCQSFTTGYAKTHLWRTANLGHRQPTVVEVAQAHVDEEVELRCSDAKRHGGERTAQHSSHAYGLCQIGLGADLIQHRRQLRRS